MASPKTQIRNAFPKLTPTDFKITSPVDPGYNCIGWAAGEDDRFWWPNGQSYWPNELPLRLTVDNFVKAFELQGYTPCDSFQLEPEYEKVALYADAAGVPTHMARQLPDGLWTSKLGREWDITHKTLVGLEGATYGSPALVLKRPRR